MKNITAMLVTFLFTITSAFSFEANWKASCGSDFSNPESGTYIFKVKKGEIGGCPSDSNNQRHASTAWKFSERAEVCNCDGNMNFGKYEWSAHIEIDRSCEDPAYRNTLFQLHDGRTGSPPSWIGIDGTNNFMVNKPHLRRIPLPEVPKNKFKLTAKIDIIPKKIDVEYLLNNKFMIRTEDDGPFTDKIFIKFGVYRVNAFCSITQTYTNVQIKKLE